MSDVVSIGRLLYGEVLALDLAWEMLLKLSYL